MPLHMKTPSAIPVTPARADAIDAVTGGPSVWIAKGKHASYLSRALCSQRGSGVDACREMVAMPPGPLINLGEADAPADGAEWIASEDWPLAAKLSADLMPTSVATKVDSIKIHS